MPELLMALDRLLEQLCAGTSHFDALQLSLQKKFAQGWMLNTQYMCGRARATMAPWAEAKPMRLKTKTACVATTVLACSMFGITWS